MSSITAPNLSPTVRSNDGAGATLGKHEFLQLLILQLRNQDPLNPIDDREFITQMAQLSSLEATQGLSVSLEQLLASQFSTQALSMVGREVVYAGPDGIEARGRASGVRLDVMPPVLIVEDREIPLAHVKKVL